MSGLRALLSYGGVLQRSGKHAMRLRKIGMAVLAMTVPAHADAQAVRSRLQPEAFRRWFLIAMILLGSYLAASAGYGVLH